MASKDPVVPVTDSLGFASGGVLSEAKTKVAKTKAKKYVDTNSLKGVKKLTSKASGVDTTKVGKTIKPAEKKPAKNSVRAKSGDSLWSLAQAHKPKGVSMDTYFAEMKRLNAGKKLFNGTKVNLPGESN